MRSRLAALLVVSCIGLPSVAAAQDDLPVVTVLGLTTDEGDDALVAENLTAVLRRAVEETRSVRASGREATLAQMSLAFGCEDPPDSTCLQQIGQEMQSKLLVLGQLARVRRGSDFAFRVTVTLFDVEAGRELRSQNAQLPRTAHDFEDLRDPARRLIAGLFATEKGGIEILTDSDGAIVRVDGELAGEVGEGRLSVTDVDVGQHRVSIEAEGHEPYETTVTVRAGETARLRARLVPLGGGGDDRRPPPRRGGGIGALQWVGIGALVAGAVLGAVAIAWAAEIQATNGTQEWTEVRYRFTQWGKKDEVCDADFSGTPKSGGENSFDGYPDADDLEPGFEPAGGSYSGEDGDTLSTGDVESLCMKSWGQWVLGGLGLASAVVGTYLVFGTSAPRSEESERASGLQLFPIVGRDHTGFGLNLAW
ncbi:MAG: PEGA domain-containing protein [Deltaproteobacteria bacterium]|nr:PEGA domain-containing protein [Deltaproteobacteria bacterium]